MFHLLRFQGIRREGPHTDAEHGILLTKLSLHNGSRSLVLEIGRRNVAWAEMSVSYADIKPIARRYVRKTWVFIG